MVVKKAEPFTLSWVIASWDKRDDVAKVKKLLEDGADPNAMDPDFDRTPLFLAMVGGSLNALDIIELLIKHDADVNAVDNKGQTPLMVAACYQYEALDCLVEAGAVLHAQDFDGNTALDLAVADGCQSSADILRKAYDAKNPSIQGFLRALEARDVKQAELLLTNGLDPHERANDGSTCLMYAITKGAPELAAKLIEMDVDIDAKEEFGFTATMYAARDDIDTLRLLVDKGADIDAKDSEGETAMGWAEENPEAQEILRMTKPQRVHNVASGNQYLISSQRPTVTVRRRPACQM